MAPLESWLSLMLLTVIVLALPAVFAALLRLLLLPRRPSVPDDRNLQRRWTWMNWSAGAAFGAWIVFALIASGSEAWLAAPLAARLLLSILVYAASIVVHAGVLRLLDPAPPAASRNFGRLLRVIVYLMGTFHPWTIAAMICMPLGLFSGRGHLLGWQWPVFITYVIVQSILTVSGYRIARWLTGLEREPDDKYRRAAAPFADEVRSIKQLDTRGADMALAFVVPRWRHLVFSDVAVRALSEAEIAAVIHHEAAHVRERRRLLLSRLLMHVGVATGYFLVLSAGVLVLDHERVFANLRAWEVGVFWLILLCVVNYSHRSVMRAFRRWEFDADQHAVAWCDDHEQFGRALIKLHLLNHMPVRFSRKGDEPHTHPSLRARLEAVNLLHLLEEPDAADESIAPGE